MSKAMRRTVFLLVLTLVWIAAPAGAAVYSSHLGFSTHLPPGWRVLSIDEIRRHSDMLDSALGNSGRGAYGDLMKQLGPMVKRGEVVYFYNRDLPDSIVSVTRGYWNLPNSVAEARNTCQTMPAYLSRLAGEPVEVHACELRRVGNSDAFYTITDAFIGGNTTYQYQIDKGRGEVLVVTALCGDQNCRPTSRQFERLVDSLRVAG